MTFLSIKDETYESMKRLRLKGETDDALIKRIVEYAKCYMIIQGAEDGASARASLGGSSLSLERLQTEKLCLCVNCGRRCLSPLVVSGRSFCNSICFSAWKWKKDRKYECRDEEHIEHV